MAKKKTIKKTIKTGRPTSYKPEYCAGLINHLGKGFSYTSYAGVVRVNIDTLYSWEKMFPAFSEAKKEAEGVSLYAIEGILLDIARSGKGNATAAIFLAKNRFPRLYRDRQEIEQTSKYEPIIVEMSDGKQVHLQMQEKKTIADS